MPLRQLLPFAQREPTVGRLVDAAAKAPQRVFASASLRPFLLAGLLDLEHISWDDSFAKFDENNLAFLYQEQKASGEDSTFFKLVKR